MKFLVTQIGTESSFEEIEVNAGGRAELQRIGAFARVRSNGETAFFGFHEAAGKNPGEKKVSIASALGNLSFTIERGASARDLDRRAGAGKTIKSSMPGRVVRVLCKAGDLVAVGQPLIVLEAMKMENEICAPIAGRVEQVDAIPDKKVETGESLVKIAPESANEAVV